MENSNYEIVKQVILNEQLGSPKNLTLTVLENSLSDSDKERIKQAVLEGSKGLGLSPERLAKSLCEAFILIQAYTYSGPE